MRVIGIDPSLTATGIVDLEVAKVAAVDVRVDINWSATIRTNPRQSLVDRLGFIASEMMQLLATAAIHHTLTVIEDVTDFRSIPGKKRKQSVISLTGAAFGVAVACATQFTSPVLYGTRDWIPQERKNKFPEHKRMRSYIRERWGLGDLTDDETFAAGLAIYGAWEVLEPDNPFTIWGTHGIPAVR